MVNNAITSSLKVEANVMDMNQAMSIGAMALFGEKYGDKVRVLKMGEFSTELCGGTHVSNTAEIGLFCVLSEGALSSGVRRIEATTSSTALKRLMDRSEYLKEIEAQVSSKDERVPEKVRDLYEEIKKLNKDKTQLMEQIEGIRGQSLFEDVTEIGNKTTFKLAEVPENADLKKLSDAFVGKFEKGLVVLYSIKGDKFNALVRTTKTTDFNANQILKAALEKSGGRGGGKPDMAQGSADSNKLKLFLEEIKQLAK